MSTEWSCTSDEGELNEVEMEWTLEGLFQTLADMTPETTDEAELYDAGLFRDARIRTLERAGYLTMDRGIEIELRTGETFILTIQMKR